MRILSAILGNLDAPETAAIACKVCLKELNTMPCNAEEFSKHQRNNKKSPYLSRVAFTNYFVFHFTETLAKNVLHVDNWPRLEVSYRDPIPLHPIRSVGLRALIEEGIDPKSISFSEPIDAIDLAVNSAGEFIVTCFDRSRNAAVYVYNESGEFQFAVSPPKEEISEVMFKPRAVFTDEKDDIYVYTAGQATTDKDNASVFVFDKKGNLQRIVSVERGFMALNTKTGNIFISNKNGVSVYENNGKFLHNFVAPKALQGSICPVAVCGENTIIQTDVHLADSKIYLLAHTTGTEIIQFPLKQARGWKYIAFNSVTDEIIVSYLSKGLTNFQLDAYYKNGQHLGTIDLPSEYSTHPRSVTVTPCGRIAILYENVVHLV